MKDTVKIEDLPLHLTRLLTEDPKWDYGVEGVSDSHSLELAVCWASFVAGVAALRGGTEVIMYGTLTEQDEEDKDLDAIVWNNILEGGPYMSMSHPGYLGYVCYRVVEIPGYTLIGYGFGDPMASALIDIMAIPHS